MCLNLALPLIATICLTLVNAEQPLVDSDQPEPIEKKFWHEYRQHWMTKEDECVADCLRLANFPTDLVHFLLQTIGDVFNLEDPSDIRRVFNETMLNMYCGYTKGRQECISGCENSFFKSEFMKLYRPTSYMCNESDFINHVQCYREVYEEDVDQCESEKCLPQKKAMVNTYMNGEKEKPESYESYGLLRARKVEQFSEKLCLYAKCGNQCRFKALSNKCGQEAAEILHEFYHRLVASVKIIIYQAYHWMTRQEVNISDVCDNI